MTPSQKFSQILHFKSKLPGKFQRFNATNGSTEVIMEIWKYQNAKQKLKIQKFKTFYKSQAAICLMEIIQPSHQIKAPYVSWTNAQEYTDMCFPSAPRIGRLEMVQCQCFFWHQPKTFFWLRCGSIFFIMLSELRFVKWVRFFERNCIVKWVIFFTSFCYLWEVLPENLKVVYKFQILCF